MKNTLDLPAAPSDTLHCLVQGLLGQRGVVYLLAKRLDVVPATIYQWGKRPIAGKMALRRLQQIAAIENADPRLNQIVGNAKNFLNSSAGSIC